MRMLRRRQVLRLAGGVAVVPAFSRLGWAESYPSRPVHVIVGFPAGLTPDVVARLVAQSVAQRLGQSFVVEDRPGSGSNIAAETVLKSAPDGYTLLAITSANSVNATLYKNLTFDIAQDAAPIAGTYRTPDVLVVTPSLPVETVPDLIAYAKAHPGQINYASAGYGTTNNIAGELFKQMTGVNLVHVPYRASYLPDLLAGQVQATFAPIATLIAHIKSGKLRALAVTSATPIESLPDVPTVGKFVPGYEVYVWGGIAAPKNTPSDIILKLNKEINSTLAEPQTSEKLVGLGAEALVMTPKDFGKFIVNETQKWAKVIQAADIKVE